MNYVNPDNTFRPNWDKGNGLVPAVAQDFVTRQVLMLGYMNQQSLALSLESGELHFYSRSRERLWKKGENSGNILKIETICLDCDKDTFLVLVRPVGPTCHEGTTSCFKKIPKTTDYEFLSTLEDTINSRWERQEGIQGKSYVASLKTSGLNRIAQKVGEEAVETILASVGSESQENFLNEGADLMFHFLVLLKAKNLQLSDIVETLKSRHGQ